MKEMYKKFALKMLRTQLGRVFEHQLDFPVVQQEAPAPQPHAHLPE